MRFGSFHPCGLSLHMLQDPALQGADHWTPRFREVWKTLDPSKTAEKLHPSYSFFLTLSHSHEALPRPALPSHTIFA